MKDSQPGAAKPRLRWTGVLFAFAANVLAVNLAHRLVQFIDWSPSFELLATLFAPLLVGVATAYYTRQRGAMHALIGGMASVLVLTYVPFAGVWQLAVLAGAFCTLGGALTELMQRSRTDTPT
jgi:hypothetical protein